MLIANGEEGGNLKQNEKRCFQEEEDPYLNHVEIFHSIAPSILYYYRELMT